MCPWCGFQNRLTKKTDCGTFLTVTCKSCRKGYVIPKESPCPVTDAESKRSGT